MNVHHRKAAQRIAKAIIQLDNASWNLGSNDTPKQKKAAHKVRHRVEQSRLSLSQCLALLGYEFAESDSPRVKRRKEVASP